MYIWVVYFVLEMMEMPFFAAFFGFSTFCDTKGRESLHLPPLRLYGCLLESAASAPWRWNTGHLIRYYLKAPDPVMKKTKKKCTHESSSEKNACFCCRPPRTFATLSVSISLSGQLANVAVIFLALSWGCGALNSYLWPPYPCMRERTWCSSQK